MKTRQLILNTLRHFWRIVLTLCLLSGAAQAAQFSLYDIFGREVLQSDYAGVPLFLEFGACW